MRKIDQYVQSIPPFSSVQHRHRSPNAGLRIGPERARHEHCALRIMQIYSLFIRALTALPNAEFRTGCGGTLSPASALTPVI